MKKLASTAIIAAGILASAVGASAANGDFVGYVYSTDILATVNDIPVTSYCLDGKTAVAVRDLESVGFNVKFFDDARIATVTAANINGEAAAEVSRGTVGEVVGTIVESDIKLYVNGIEVPSYNIGGRLVAAIEDLAPDDSGELSPIGYSETELSCAWDEQTRTIALYSLYSRVGNGNKDEAEQIALDHNLTLCVTNGDGMVTFENNAYPEFTDSGIKAGIAERYEPLYYIGADGTRTEVGYAYRHRYMVVSRQYTYNGELMTEIVDSDPEYTMSDEVYTVNGILIGNGKFYFDLDALEAICDANPGIHATIEDEVAYWERGGNSIWNVQAKFETEDFVLLTMRSGGLPHGGPYYRTLRLDREPRTTVKISDEWMTGAELYGDTLYYISGTGIYKQNVYETEAEFVREATDENIDAYLRDYFEVLYEAEDEASHVYILERDGSYRIYYIGKEYGVRSTYLDEVDEIYAYDTRVVYTVGGESKYLISGEEYNVVDNLVDDAAEIMSEGTRVV